MQEFSLDQFEFQVQRQLEWFPQDDTTNAPSEDLRKLWVNPNNQENPFSKYVGNEQAVRRLSRAAYTALERYNRCCSDQYFAFLGPASTGKTTLAKMFAELMDIPFVEISPRSVKTLNDIFAQIAKVMEDTIFTESDGTTTSLELVELDDGKFVLPPCIVFIDEVHSLRDNIVQGLLKATEKKDHTLVTEKGWSVNCANVCWMIATTDRGCLFDAFDTRFTKVNLRLYSLDEIAKIIQINYPDWDFEICQLVAKYAGKVPREALAFANEMELEHNMNDGDWEEIAAIVAEDNGIDPFGMTYQRLAILKALGQGPIARARLPIVAGCKEGELDKFILPTLLATTPDQEPLIEVTGRGYTITDSGIIELDKRNIKHLGSDARKLPRNRLSKILEN